MARELAVGIAGLGTIGGALARLIASGGIPGQRLAAVGVRSPGKVASVLEAPPADLAVTDLAGLAAHSDVVVECAPAAVFEDCAGPAVEAGGILLPAKGGPRPAPKPIWRRPG